MDDCQDAKHLDSFWRPESLRINVAVCVHKLLWACSASPFKSTFHHSAAFVAICELTMGWKTIIVTQRTCFPCSIPVFSYNWWLCLQKGIYWDEFSSVEHTELFLCPETPWSTCKLFPANNSKTPKISVPYSFVFFLIFYSLNNKRMM